LGNPFNVEDTRLFVTFENHDVINFQGRSLGSLAREPSHVKDIAWNKHWGHRKAIYFDGAKKSHAR